jgi:hypothetical protein
LRRSVQVPEYGAARLLVAAEKVECRRLPCAAWNLIAWEEDVTFVEGEGERRGGFKPKPVFSIW